MTPLTLVHPDLSSFGSRTRPLRPSRVATLLECPMALVLTLYAEDAGNTAAQTGSLLHAATEAYHKTNEADRLAAGLAALQAARVKFPEGDAERAEAHFRPYAADKKNAEAKVLWCEEGVTLTLPAAPGDPTGEKIVIQGTLDQVRLTDDGSRRVWDCKTGKFHSADETALQYSVQQACYVLAARQTLHAEILPGGIIYTEGYLKGSRAQTHVKSKTKTIQQCWDLLALVPFWVAAVRKGEAVARPSVESCRFCKCGPYPHCHEAFQGLYGVNTHE